MIRIGITGGIGSGKTTVCRVLESMSYPVFYSDTIAKSLLINDPILIKEVKLLFGNEAYEGNELNRKYIADQLFHDRAKKDKMNALVHPKVREAFELFSHRQTSTLVFNEAALLFETDGYLSYDGIFLVTAPLQKRIARTMKRDSCTRNEVLARINNQMTDDQKLNKKWTSKFSPNVNLSAYQLINSDKKLLVPQIEKLLEQILKDEIYY